MSTNLKINNHPFYQDPINNLDKRILEKIIQICEFDFDESVGIINYFPIIQIGFLSEILDFKSIPSFKEGSMIRIHLSFSKAYTIFDVPKGANFEIVEKIINPIRQNWLEISTSLIHIYEDYEKGNEFYELILDSCVRSLEIWKKEFV